jgi:hypothetical protein
VPRACPPRRPLGPPLQWHGTPPRVGGLTHLTSEDREDSKRHVGVGVGVGVGVEGLGSEILQAVEGVATSDERLEHFRDELKAFRAETASAFAVVGREFKTVRNEAKAFRHETTREFAAVRSEMAGAFGGVRAEIGASYSDVDRHLKAVEGR